MQSVNSGRLKMISVLMSEQTKYYILNARTEALIGNAAINQD